MQLVIMLEEQFAFSRDIIVHANDSEENFEQQAHLQIVLFYLQTQSLKTLRTPPNEIN